MEEYNSSKQVVRAIIPHIENPNLHIVDVAGRYPSIAGELRTSQEELLWALSREVIGRVVSIDRQDARRNVRTHSGEHNVADLRTKPVDPTQITLAQGYTWGNESQGA